jgi:alcohol dehydrogenase (cytochrome c)
MRKLMLFANRNAFYYVLDRITGEFLSATPFARQNWALSIDASGRPAPNPETVPNLKGAIVYPDDDGSANWFSPSYSPQTGLFYQNVREKGQVYFRTEAAFEPGRMFTGAAHRGVPGEEPWGALRALDALTGARRWEFRLQTPPWAGLMSTAGGLVFSGTMEGDFFALDAASGKLLWRFQTGGAIWANPISYQYEGKQFIAVAAGSSLITFALE